MYTKRTNKVLRHELDEKEKDLAVFVHRSKESTVSYKTLLKKLKTDGKI